MKEILDFILTFSSVLWEALPFIVLGAVIAGILEELLPQQLITRILPKQVLPAIVIGALLGLIFPMCECGIVVVMRRLLRKGLPLSCCIAYMLAGPIINLVVIFSTYVAFKGHGIAEEMVALRVGLGFIVAVLTALVVQVQYRKYGNSLLTAVAAPREHHEEKKASASSLTVLEGEKHNHTHDENCNHDHDNSHDHNHNHSHEHGHHHHHAPAKKSILDRLGNISATAIHDFVDITVFLILGAVLAALAKQQISPVEVEQLSANQPFLAIPVMMLLAVLMCLCSEADAFVAASFTSMHISAKLAFLVLGPMLDLKLLMMYTRVFKPRLIITITTCVIVLVLALCMLVHLIYQANGWNGLPTGR